MKKIILFVLWIIGFGTHIALSQISLLSDKELEVLQPFNEHDRADTLIDWAYSPHKRDKEQCYTMAALEYAEKARYSRGRADCFVKLGHIALFGGRIDQSYNWYAQGLHIRDSLGLTKGVASCYNNLGLVQKKRSNYDAAAVLFQKGLDLLETEPADNIAIQLHNNLGTALRYQGRYGEALEHFRLSMTLSRKGNKVFNIAQARLNIGNLLQDNLNKFEEAHDSLELCLADFSTLANLEFIGKSHLGLGNNEYYKGRLKEAQYQYNQALAVGTNLGKEDQAIAFKNRGRVYLEQQKYKAALRDFQTSLDGFTVIGNTREIAATHFEMGNFYYEQSKMDSAVACYKRALVLNPEDILLKCRILYFLSDALDQLGSKEAAAFYTNTYIQALNTLNDEQTRGAFEEMNRYQLDKNRLLKRLLDQENKTIRIYALIGFSVLLFFALVLFFRARFNAQKRSIAERNAEIARQREELARKNEAIAIQEKLELLKNKELDAQYARMEGQGIMQKQIGKELHDGLGTLLSTVKLNLAPVDEVLDKLTDSHKRQYATANRLLDEACVGLRRIAHELGSPTLSKFGLKAELESFKDNISDSGKLEVELSTHGIEARLDYNMELNLYRIVQELAQNVIKHAQASKISIQVNRFDNMINVIVEDNGLGFDLEKARQKPGYGMFSLESRVHNLHGKMFIDTQPGRGTTTSIDIPLFHDAT